MTALHVIVKLSEATIWCQKINVHIINTIIIIIIIRWVANALPPSDIGEVICCASHAWHRCSLLRQMSCLCVCWCVDHIDILCKNDWTHRDAIWGRWLVSQRNHVLGSRSPTWRGSFGNLSGPLKSTGCPCNNGVTYDTAFHHKFIDVLLMSRHAVNQSIKIYI